ncbi:MAG: DUF2997 domain-containing protein [Planctomycetaceae bacterium]|jgi:hypothetical protein|nr:DUF2997 domain-containing protein [Planctomycetaceae bacterium]
MRIIEIVVSPTGQTQVETKGFSGSGCRDASRFIEEALGKCTGEKLTGEFYAETSVDQHNRQTT